MWQQRGLDWSLLGSAGLDREWKGKVGLKMECPFSSVAQQPQQAEFWETCCLLGGWSERREEKAGVSQKTKALGI